MTGLHGAESAPTHPMKPTYPSGSRGSGFAGPLAVPPFQGGAP
jgi:hypothetical protein